MSRLSINIHLRNFLSVKRAEIKSDNPITVIVAPNRSGKTHILQLIYSILWGIWRYNIEEGKADLKSVISSKIKGVLLLKKIDEITSWGEKFYKVEVGINNEFYLKLVGPPANMVYDGEIKLENSPIYIQPAGMGLYYKGIHSMKKYYRNWRLITESITDFLSDLFVVAERNETSPESRELLEEFEKFFGAKFYIQQERIYVKEEKSYMIEKAASGLQNIAWLYLAIKHNLLGNILILDEPEVNLHPQYIDNLVELLVLLSRKTKIFIATHSDYLLESLNKHIKQKGISVDVWTGILKENGAEYDSYTASRENLIDSSPLSEVYLNILEDTFGYEKDQR